jgi:hypothetical protein
VEQWGSLISFETFLDKLTELQKAFRQHARDDKKELLPAMQRALSEEQVQTVTEKFETGLAEADQAKQDEAEERRMAARRQRASRPSAKPRKPRLSSKSATAWSATLERWWSVPQSRRVKPPRPCCAPARPQPRTCARPCTA